MRLVLLDRDGVINEDLPDSVRSTEEFRIFPEALEALALLAGRGFTCALVTNQSVVGRGIISGDALERIHNHLLATVQAQGGHIDRIFCCTDHPAHATYRRKPNPGMLLEALKAYGAEGADTPFIGDAISDIEAARAAGCIPFLVLTGKGVQTAERFRDDLQGVTQCRNLLDAAHKIMDR